jgi:limonene-1,2-epoxide hydrolase
MRAMLGIRPIAALVALALAPAALPACGWGGGSDEPADAGRGLAGDADPEAVEVIAEWSDALRGGDVDAAAELFAIPSVAQNGLSFRINSREAALAFNRSLPCGARLVKAEDEGALTTATFRLTERPGPGSCGRGTGEIAITAFRIRDGEIVEWRRVPSPSPGPSAPGQVT